MSKFTVCYAADTPRYGEVEIEADTPEQAIERAKTLWGETDLIELKEDGEEGNWRIVDIRDDAKNLIAEQIPLDHDNDNPACILYVELIYPDFEPGEQDTPSRIEAFRFSSPEETDKARAGLEEYIQAIIPYDSQEWFDVYSPNTPLTVTTLEQAKETVKKMWAESGFADDFPNPDTSIPQHDDPAWAEAETKASPDLSTPEGREENYLAKGCGICPFCQSTDIEGTGNNNETDSDWHSNDVCNACGKEWKDVYNIVGIQEL